MADDSAVAARVISILAIIICSLVGVLYPLHLVEHNKDVVRTEWYGTLKTASTGLVLGVAFMHLLDDANDALSQESDYPFAGLGLLIGVVLVTVMEQLVAISLSGVKNQAGCFKSSDEKSLEMGSKACCAPNGSYQNGGGAADHAAGVKNEQPTQAAPLTSPVFNATHSLTVLPLLKDESSDGSGDNLPARMEIFFLEVSISLHSIILGFGLGIMTSTSAVLSLTLALVFHQFFEGIALGMAAAKPGLDRQVRAGAVAIFTLSLPLGGVIGMLVASGVSTETPASHWILGGCNAIAAGMLTQIGFMHFLQEDFGCINHHHEHEHGHGHAASLTTSMSKEEVSLVHKKLAALAAGCAVMSVLAIWG